MDERTDVEVPVVGVSVEHFSPASDLQRVLSVRQVAHWLRLAPETVEQMAVTGELPARVCDGEWRFGAVAINDWLMGRSRLTDRAESILATVTETLVGLKDQTGVLADRLATKLPTSGVSGSEGALRFDLEEPITLHRVEELYIQFVLDKCQGNKSHAAQWLGVDASTLYRKLSRYSWGDQAVTHYRGAGD